MNFSIFTVLYNHNLDHVKIESIRKNELPPSRVEVSSKKNFIFSLIKTSGFQTFLLTTEAEPRGILSIKIQKY